MPSKDLSLLKSDVIKIRILRVSADGLGHTANEFATKFRINSITVRRNCMFLQKIGLIESSKAEPKQKVVYYRITAAGKQALVQLKKVFNARKCAEVVG